MIIQDNFRPGAVRRWQVLAKAVFVVSIEVLVVAGLVFSGAGTFQWMNGWAFVVFLFAGLLGATIFLALEDPGLLYNRLRASARRDETGHNRVLQLALSLATVGWCLFAGIDAIRFGWSQLAGWVQVAGGVVMFAGMVGATWTMAEVSIRAPGSPRRQDARLVDTGAYGVVRHPLYSFLIVTYVGGSFLLGSWLSLAFAAVAALALAVRIPEEEEILSRQLMGYHGYQKTVRHRLLPGLW